MQNNASKVLINGRMFGEVCHVTEIILWEIILGSLF